MDIISGKMDAVMEQSGECKRTTEQRGNAGIEAINHILMVVLKCMRPNNAVIEDPRRFVLWILFEL